MKLKHFTLAFLSVFLFGFFFYNSSIKAAESQTVNVTTVDIDTLTPTELSNMINGTPSEATNRMLCIGLPLFVKASVFQTISQSRHWFWFLRKD